MSLPEIRREDAMLIGYSQRRIRRSRSRHVRILVVCVLRGHAWRGWRIDDVDGPGEDLGDGAFMPYFSRESRPGEFGLRTCGRGCGASESRWPEHGAPRAWREAVDDDVR